MQVSRALATREFTPEVSHAGEQSCYVQSSGYSGVPTGYLIHVSIVAMYRALAICVPIHEISPTGELSFCVQRPGYPFGYPGVSPAGEQKQSCLYRARVSR